MKLKDQLILAIEATNHPVSVALLDQGNPLGLIWLNVPQTNSVTLLSSLDELLSKTGKDKSELQGIAVSLGPGSFTSVRVALATAEGLAMALHLPLYGLGLLEIMAATISFGPKRVHVAQNAYKGEVYHALFDCSDVYPTALSNVTAVTPQALYESFLPGDLVIGSGLAVFEEKGFDLSQKQVHSDFSFSRQANALVLAESLQHQEAQAPGLKILEPIYIRASEAEINYEKHFLPRSLNHG